MADKLPPQNLEAEKSLLGSILLDADALIKVGDKLAAEDFYDTKHQQIYTAVVSLYERQRPIDVLTVSNHLREHGELDGIGGAAYLTELVNGVPTSTHAHYYAEIVHKKGTLRRLIKASSDIISLGYDESADVTELLSKAEERLFSVSQQNIQHNISSIEDILDASFERLDKLHRDKGSLRGTPTGFLDLDNKLAGLQKSDMIVLAARPAMGKTTFALNIAHHVALKEKKPVLVFSLEMSKEQLVDRLLSAESGIDSWNLRTGRLSDKDFERLGEAMGALSEAKIYIDDTPGITALEMRTKARREQHKHQLGLIVIDYLQLMSGSSRSDGNRVQEISEISRGVKALARELNVPVIALSQLSRTVEQRHPQIPQLSDLRESGSIEQDADVVMFIYRDEYYNPESTEKPNIADIIISKHRNGPTGKIELFFHGEQLAFRNIDRKHEHVEIPQGL